jgi:hypothetical protein
LCHHVVQICERADVDRRAVRVIVARKGRFMGRTAVAMVIVSGTLWRRMAFVRTRVAAGSLRAAEAFSTGAEETPAPKSAKKVPILVRFARALLERVDRAAKRRGIGRNRWVHYQISRALEAEDA